MSPAGYWPQLQAAVEAGADSVYFGLRHFTARAKVGFALDELDDVLRSLHQRGVRGFVTFNTLVFDHELAEAARALAAIAAAGADAIIVQDIAVLELARRIAPGLEIHASTQMSVTDARGARLAQEMGARRVTLGRELSLGEIRRIRDQTQVELEVFVHGALCVAYSGQCFSSEAWGGRSANRGQCAQACRLPYEMLVDGAYKPLGDARYLLSPGDLYALHQVPELLAAGVSALKIEGRYKEAGYVAAVTSAYRKAVDQAASGTPLSITEREELGLQQVYSRGMGPYFLSGTNHQAVVEGRAPRHRGVRMGRVAKVTPAAVVVETTEAHGLSPLKPGDGLVFDAADWRSPEEPEEGGRLYSVRESRRGFVELGFGNGALDTARIRPGDIVWRTNDPALEKALKALTHAASPVRRQTVNVEVTAAEGRPLESVWRLDEATSVTVRSSEPLPRAEKQSLTEESLRLQWERLGGTPYQVGHINLKTEGQPFAPASLLNQLRREAVRSLAELQAHRAEAVISDSAGALKDCMPAARPEPDAGAAPHLHLLVRTPDQLEAAIEMKPSSVTLDYLDLYGLRPSVDRLRQAGIAARVASPRILKPGEEKIAEFLVRLGCPILVRPAGLLAALREEDHAELTGDFSLNAANVISTGRLLAMGLARLTPTHDLNGAQIAALAREVGGGRIEAIAYQHLPVFHTEHCVFCRFLSTGTTYEDCGRPCEKHRVELRDVGGRSHPVLADVGCRNTVFGAEAQEASAFLGDWLSAGIRHFRLEFAHESAPQVKQITQAFADALGGKMLPRQLQEAIRRLAPQGATQGSLRVGTDHLALPVLQ